MKIVNIIGGLGNQMFQYAFAVALKKQNPEESVKIDTQLFRFPLIRKFKGNNFYHNGFEIQKIFPNAQIAIATFCDLVKNSYYIPNYILYKSVRRLLHYRKSEFLQTYKEAYIYDPTALTNSASYYEGYWMSPSYFESCRRDILDAFTFRDFDTDENAKWQSLLMLDNSVTIHVRRGDYVGAESFKDICTLTYYRNAIREVKRYIASPAFYVFSNDQEWCMNNLGDAFGDSNVSFVSNNKGNQSYRDMQLMSLARCNILANSSFSWWGAYLNQREDHIVFCPEKWVNNLKCDDILLKEWIIISGK